MTSDSSDDNDDSDDAAIGAVTSTGDAVTFAREATLANAPDQVRRQVRVRVLDTLAAITAGYSLSGTDIIRDYAVDRFAGASEATVLDGTAMTLRTEGTVLVNAMAANALDIDDGHRLVKGHPAAIVVPTALAAAESADVTVSEFLDAVFVGYELGVHAGLLTHAAHGYSGTGSWGALGAAAAVARLRGLSAATVADALGTAEYHAPRTPILRGVDFPGMTKDGISWGAYAGTVATSLAERGFTGSGTVFDADGTEFDTLGDRFHVMEGYLKPYPCCRWAHPGIDAALSLRETHSIDPAAVREVQVSTFAEATGLDIRAPTTPEEAEYSYPYPLAVALDHGEFTPAELKKPARTDPSIRALAKRVRLRLDPAIDDRFPKECLARVRIRTDGNEFTSSIVRPRGARERPLSADEHHEKVHRLLAPTLSPSAIDSVEETLRRGDTTVAELLSSWRAE